MTKPIKKSVAISLPGPMAEALEEKARRNQRSLSGQLVFMLRESILKPPAETQYIHQATYVDDRGTCRTVAHGGRGTWIFQDGVSEEPTWVSFDA